MTASTDVVTLLEELIRIDSANPALVPGAPGEARIADHVTGWLTSRGFTCHRLEGTPGRPSVVAIHPGSGGGSSIMLNGHIDTVSHGSYDGDGCDPVHRDGNLYGRGAYDMKSGIAATMTAAAQAATRPHAGNIVLALVADEEYASAGTEEVLAGGYTADAAIVVEPTGLDLVIAHRGFAWFDLIIHGRAAHGSRRDLGIDAIARAGVFLTALAGHDTWLGDRAPHPLLGTGNLHASTITGGEERSSYPASCHIALERRTLPGETAGTVEAELRRVLDPIAAADPAISYQLHPVLERHPFQTDPAQPIVQTLQHAIAAETGHSARLRGEPFWTDCALLADAGIPTAMFGVDGGGAHAATEWVTLDSLRATTAVLRRTITDTIGTPANDDPQARCGQPLG